PKSPTRNPDSRTKSPDTHVQCCRAWLGGADEDGCAYVLFAAACAFSSACSGNAMVNLLPSSGMLFTDTWTPGACTMCRTNESPRPLPLVLCTKGSPTR